MKKIFTFGAIALALIIGFASCDKNEEQALDLGQKDVDTYVGVSVAFQAPNMRAGLPDDYRKIGEWQGDDNIENVMVYVVTDNKTINSSSFTKGSFSAINNGVLSPTLAVPAKAGQNVKAYVVINDRKNVIINELNKLGAAEFDEKFASTVVKVASVSDVAGARVVAMTNSVAPEGVTIEAGVTEEDAKKGPKNLIKVNVSRVVTRGIVTMGKGDNVIKVTKTVTKTEKIQVGKIQKYETKTNKEETAQVTVTDVEYRISGSALQFNMLEDATNWKVPADVYDFMPATDWATTLTNAKDKMHFYDSSYNEWHKVIEKENNELANVTAALTEEKTYLYALPVTHAEGNYKKGNTTMFEIKANFTVDKIDGVAPTGTEPQTVYFGLSDGLFYSTKEKGEAMDATGASTEKKQEVKEYKNGEMYYYIWLNPDVAYDNVEDLIKESPTLRNHIYNAHITGFGEMGVASKEEIEPDEPLETEKTHLSVEITVLPWTIHSYKVELGNRY